MKNVCQNICVLSAIFANLEFWMEYNDVSKVSKCLWDTQWFGIRDNMWFWWISMLYQKYVSVKIKNGKNFVRLWIKVKGSGHYPQRLSLTGVWLFQIAISVICLW